MNERGVTFGPNDGIVGVLTEPQTVEGPKRAVLMSNVGMHHRVGPFRLYVDLARAMAEDGWYALRFDNSGMGDSTLRGDGLDVLEAPTQDLIDAMDFLRDTQAIEEFTVIGLCSGVDSAHDATVRDPRIRGAIFIDGYTYPTSGFYRRRYVGKRLVEPGRWKRFVRRRLREFSATPTIAGTGDVVFDRVYPPIERFQQDIERVLARGVEAYFVFTGTVNNHFNAERQLFEMLSPRVPKAQVSVTMLESTDHIFTRVEARQDLIRRVKEWARRLRTP